MTAGARQYPIDQVEHRELLKIVRHAIREDVGRGDVTSKWTIPADLCVRGQIIAKANGIVAGLEVAALVFSVVDKNISFVPLVADGDVIVPGDILAEVRGPARSILSAERVALNFLQRMSGIATTTRRYVEAVKGTRARILDTRKTAPGLRLIDKMAVRAGGGQNHRFGLSDMVLIKDNHIIAAGSITAAVERVRTRNRKGLPIEVEVRNLDELHEALALGVDRIMLDNMSLEDMYRAVAITAGRAELEASGNVRLENVAAIAATGVDCISVGALTHSVSALDMSLEIEGEERKPSITLPEKYERLTWEEIEPRLWRAKAKLGADLVILGHHYQRDEIIRFADYRGDSLELSRQAASAKRAKYIVFCGVNFMAETAAMLCSPEQLVIIPDSTSACPMAAMADADDAEVAWEHLSTLWPDDIIPITYQNSLAPLKAFCGRRGGAVCTSANAKELFRWAFAQKGHLLFFPDEFLGRNTALALGIPPHEISLWDPATPEASREMAQGARVVVWKGYCHVHTHFKVEHVLAVRTQYPDIQVIVHPECPVEVVQAADLNGSTSFIVRTIENAPSGSSWAVGTEINLVARLAKENPDKTIVPLARSLCGAMYRINPHNLLWILEELVAGRPHNVVHVDTETTYWANLALEKMLAAK
ncbi:MAG: quinolinate synthase NadA [Chloroflexi bacterium]|nr:quinolinate synthase NadA [Chloroflexota bacterium]